MAYYLPETSSHLTFTTPSSKLYSSETHSKSVLSGLLSQRHEGKFTDVVIKVKNVEIPCHKAVLAASSKYFDAMFHTEMKECITGIVSFDHINVDLIKEIVESCYTGEIEITTENVGRLSQASDQFELSHIKTSCDKFLREQLRYGNCFGLYMFCKLYTLENTLSASWKCMLNNLRHIMKQAVDSEFAILGTEDIKEYISSDELMVGDESLVFELVTKWVNVNIEERKSLFVGLLEKVRLPFCTTEYLLDVVQKNPLVRGAECQALLDEAETFHLLPEPRPAMECPRATPRRGYHGNPLVLLGYSTQDRTMQYWVMKDLNHQWEEVQKPKELKNINIIRACIAGPTLITSIYDVDDFEHTVIFWLFDLRGRQWSKLPQLKEKFRGYTFSMVANNNDVYVIGGYEETGYEMMNYHRDQRVVSMEKYDTANPKGTWTFCPPMITDQHSAHTVDCEGKIYLLGGENYRGIPTFVTSIFDPVYECWQTGKPMPDTITSINSSAVSFNGCIYILSQGQCLQYTPHSDSWTTMQIPSMLHDLMAVAWQGEILVAGTATGMTGTATGIQEQRPRRMFQQNRQRIVCGHRREYQAMPLLSLRGVEHAYLEQEFQREEMSCQIFQPEQQQWSASNISPPATLVRPYMMLC